MTQDKTRPHADQTLPPRFMRPIISGGDQLGAPAPTPRRPAPLPATAPLGPGLREPRAITLRQGPQEYLLRTSARARRVRLVVQPGGALEVVAPQSATLTRVETALREHETWIIRTRARLAATTPLPDLEPLTEGRALPCAGRELRLSLRVGEPAGRIQTRVVDDQLTLTLPRDDETLARAALERWYRRHAQTVFAERLAHWNVHYGYTWTRVAIKEQKTRWGSCSRLGALNFNWRLMLAPLPVLDYVVIHELCHLKEPNHGPRFWALVARACPDHRERRDWLRQHGHELRL